MRLSKDLVGGVMFTAIGLGAFAIARTYPYGATLNMGPGYFPTIVAGLIIVFGVVISAQAMRARDADLVGRLHLRPLALIVASILSFALLIDTAGILVAVSALCGLGWYANPARRLRDLAIVVVVGIAVPIIVFKYGLNMPVQLWIL